MQNLNFIQNLINRYNSHFIVSLFWIIILFSKLFSQHENLYEMQSLIWFIIIFGSSIFIPIFTLSTILIYKAIYDVEQECKNFRISYALAKNPLYAMIFYLSFILAWISLIFLICDSVYIIVKNENMLILFFPFGLLLTIALIPFYWVLKKLLINLLH